MECLEDVRSILQGIIFAQSAGAYTLENSEQIAPVVRRVLNRYPQLNGNPQPQQVQQRPVQQTTQPQQVPQRQGNQGNTGTVQQSQRPVQQTTQPQKTLKPRETKPDKVDELIQNIKAEVNKVEDAESNIEIESVKKSALDIEDTDIESISLPLE